LLYNPKSKYLIKTNPTIGVKGAKKVENKKEQIILSSYHQKMLIKFAKNSRDKAILMLYLSTGLRVNELISLTLSQYNNRSEDNCIELTVTKGSHNRNIWLSDDVVSAIDTYLADRKETDCDNLFISNGGQPMDRSCLSRTIKTIAKRTNIFTDDEISKMANHTCRRSLSSTLLNDKDVPIDVVAKLLGHSNLGSVIRYAKTSEDRIKRAMIG
jgi:integrase/recombinase XerD